MWKRDPQEDYQPTPVAEPARPMERSVPERVSNERATIGRSITIRGEVTGDEDLLIQGRVDGSVNLTEHAITVGPQGEVRGDIHGRVVIVEGVVDGNLNAKEQVTLQASARVEGDIAAPRVRLEDGAYFRGGVDMGESPDRAGAKSKPSAVTATPVKVPAGVVDGASRPGPAKETPEKAAAGAAAK